VALFGLLGKAVAKRVERLPVFPLGTVLFPGGSLPLKIFEQRYMDMAKACLKQDLSFGVCLIREGSEVGAPAVPEETGTLAKIVEWDMEQLGVLKVRVEGGERFRLLSTEVQASGLIIGEIERFSEKPAASGELEACAAFLRKVVAAVGAGQFAEPMRFDEVSWVGFRLAEILPLRPDVKQRLLELTDGPGRLKVLYRFLEEQRLLA
jgi:Lon protease-like protein